MTAFEPAPTMAGQLMGGRAVPAATVTAACAAALLAAWLVPGLAVLFVWPLLFVVPGWVAVAALRP
ncbi:MAG TPA: hypothetical protein VHU77_06600, partial [Candidatus Limnocylindria bacterium]|nr:hypothetical protein [Candidatus Limnocylindria bacterium]